MLVQYQNNFSTKHTLNFIKTCLRYKAPAIYNKRLDSMSALKKIYNVIKFKNIRCVVVVIPIFEIWVSQCGNNENMDLCTNSAHFTAKIAVSRYFQFVTRLCTNRDKSNTFIKYLYAKNCQVGYLIPLNRLSFIISHSRCLDCINLIYSVLEFFLLA